MRLHRLVLTNYRGIEHREIDFPDHGVVVVSGANEVGKSSMVEALDLLLESKDRSTRKEVKQVKPTHADVGSEVTAEISAGAYRFVYRKRFHKKCETQLTVLEPRREQHSGDEAHERVQAILAETVDTGLWRAQRVLQSTSTDAVTLSGCDALTRALDVAAGDAAALSGGEPLLIERIDREYARYFTPTGRPTAEWSTAIKALEAAESQVALCAAAVAEVDERVQSHAELTAEFAELTDRLGAAAARQTAARAAADAVTRLSEQVREADLVAAAASATSAASNAALAERARLRTESESRSVAISSMAAEVESAVEARTLAATVSAEADDAVERADQALRAAQQRADAARSAVEELARRDEAERLAGKLARVDAALTERAEAARELATVTVTDELLRRIEQAASTVDKTGGQLALLSATVEFVAAADIELVIGDQLVPLPAGSTWSTVANSPTEIEIPGVVTARVTPGTSAIEIQRRHVAALETFGAALSAAGVTGLAEARAADLRRRELCGIRDQLTATLDGLLGDDDIDVLREQLAEMRSRNRDCGAVEVDPAAARAELLDAVAAREQAAVDCDTHRKVAALANRKAIESQSHAARIQDKLVIQQAELAAVADRLAGLRASVPDEVLAGTVDADTAAARVAAERAGELARQLATAEPDNVAAELTAATTEAESVQQRHREVDRALHETSAQLAVFGTEGRRGQLDAAEIECQHARDEHDRVGRRARAVQLLREVMTRHRDTTRLRYVEPFRAELERLGKPVFGPTFEVGVDSDLCIVDRTLEGRTVPYESLSGGAKEQLGILARLAGAALVAKEDAVPVVIDDALGFTDPQRLLTMASVFDTLGERGQVIVLTCTPARYEHVKDAHRIELCA